MNNNVNRTSQKKSRIETFEWYVIAKYTNTESSLSIVLKKDIVTV